MYHPAAPNGLPAFITVYADTDISAPYSLELCDAFTQWQIISQDVVDYIYVTICSFVGPTKWMSHLFYATIPNQSKYTNSTGLITHIMGYEIFTAMPPALRWGMVNNNQARYHYVAYTKQTGYKDISRNKKH